jgi:hypothetical protein
MQPADSLGNYTIPFPTFDLRKARGGSMETLLKAHRLYSLPLDAILPS